MHCKLNLVDFGHKWWKTRLEFWTTQNHISWMLRCYTAMLPKNFTNVKEWSRLVTAYLIGISNNFLYIKIHKLVSDYSVYSSKEALKHALSNEMKSCIFILFGSSANIQQWASPFTAGVSWLSRPDQLTRLQTTSTWDGFQHAECSNREVCVERTNICRHQFVQRWGWNLYDQHGVFVS